MRIFRIVLLGLAMALFAINFWAIDYQDLWGKTASGPTSVYWLLSLSLFSYYGWSNGI